MNRYLSEVTAAKVQRVQRPAAIVGVVALVICVIAAPFSPEQFFRAYLAAYEFYLDLALGSFVIVMMYQLTGGAWGFLIQRILEAGVRTLPYLAVLFIPIICGFHYLYPWAQPDLVAMDENLQHKQIYLNVPFVLARAILFFALWIGLGLLLDRWSWRHDETGDERLARRRVTLSGPGLIVFGITFTFAAVDWLMSLEPTFHSTIFGPLVVTGQIVAAHALALIILAWLASDPSFADVVSPKVLNDLGNLLFTFLVLWSYMVWFQFMLIWIADLPHEVSWYLLRSEGGWQWVAWTLLVFHFTIPFFLLLLRDVKQHLPTLAKIAGLILGMHLVYVFYLVMPSFPDTSLSQHWMDFLMPPALGGIWLWCFLRELGRRPLLARKPDDRTEALRLRAVDEEAARRLQEA